MSFSPRAIMAIVLALALTAGGVWLRSTYTDLQRQVAELSSERDKARMSVTLCQASLDTVNAAAEKASAASATQATLWRNEYDKLVTNAAKPASRPPAQVQSARELLDWFAQELQPASVAEGGENP